MMKLLGQLIQGTEGQDLIEYALLTAAISLVAVVTVTTLGTSVATVFQVIANQLEN